MHDEKLLLDIFINPHQVPHYVSYAFLASIILIVVGLLVRSSLKLIPTGIQNFMEAITEGIYNLAEENIGHHWTPSLFPLIATIALYIAVCNFMGLIPGLYSPTSNVNNNAAMAIPVFLATHVFGVRAHGVGYFKHFLGPVRSILHCPL